MKRTRCWLTFSSFFLRILILDFYNNLQKNEKYAKIKVENLWKGISKISKFVRKINYYETDKMGVVHHSNYIRFLEEARTFWLNEMNMPFENLEENGITIPVLEVNVSYKHPVTFADIIEIEVFVKEYNGVRMKVRISCNK